MNPTIKMTINRKLLIVVGIGVVILSYFIIKNVVQKNTLRSEYVKELKKQESDYIKEFHSSQYIGVISYIKKYDEETEQYVIAIKDSLNNEKTIGKVKISNFHQVKIGDSAWKKPNSFDLEILKQGRKYTSVISFE